MRPKALSILIRIAFAIGFVLAFATAASALPAGFHYKVLADGLDLVSSAVLPDGRVLAVEKYGKITLIHQETGAKTTALDLSAQTWSNYEAGMTQALPDPAFKDNGYVYIQYCKKGAVNGEDHDWVDRFTMKGDVIDPASAFKIMDNGFRGPNYHHGSGLSVNPKDGMLYINCGSRRNQSSNQNQPEMAGNTKVVFGKVLRVKIPSGEIPSDNPFFAQNTGDARAVYYYGLRNPFTLMFHPVTAALWIADVQDNSGGDEINLGGAPGTGYGYGGGSQGPLFTTDNAGGGSGARIGILWYTGTNFPAAYQGKVFLGQVRGIGGNLHVIAPGSKDPEDFGPFNLPDGKADDYNPIDIKMDAAGAIYVSTRFQTENVRWSKGRVIKVWYGDKEPTIPVPTSARLAGQAPRPLAWRRTVGGKIMALITSGAGTGTMVVNTLDGRTVPPAGTLNAQ